MPLPKIKDGASLGKATRSYGEDLGISEAMESLIAYCRENDRVCPLPPLWSRLWKNVAGPLAGWHGPTAGNASNPPRDLSP